MHLKNTKSAQRLVGKKIARVALGEFPNGRGGTATNPILIFEDGTALTFHVEETDIGVGDYGVTLVYSGRAKRTQ